VQDVAAPLMVKPVLQVNWQLLPEESEAGQLPTLPFAGAVTAQAFAVQVWFDVRTPREQLVTEPLRVKPELQATEQLVPDASVDGQLPRLPFAGAITVQALGVQDCCEVSTPSEQVVAAPLTV
jgi:hypothetical protein